MIYYLLLRQLVAQLGIALRFRDFMHSQWQEDEEQEEAKPKPKPDVRAYVCRVHGTFHTLAGGRPGRWEVEQSAGVQFTFDKCPAIPPSHPRDPRTRPIIILFSVLCDPPAHPSDS